MRRVTTRCSDRRQVCTRAPDLQQLTLPCSAIPAAKRGQARPQTGRVVTSERTMVCRLSLTLRGPGLSAIL